MRAKQCKVCGESKPITEFYENHTYQDNYERSCKECKKRQSRENRAANIEHYKAYERRRNQGRCRKQWYHEREKTEARQALYDKWGRKRRRSA